MLTYNLNMQQPVVIGPCCELFNARLLCKGTDPHFGKKAAAAVEQIMAEAFGQRLLQDHFYGFGAWMVLITRASDGAPVAFALIEVGKRATRRRKLVPFRMTLEGVLNAYCSLDMGRLLYQAAERAVCFLVSDSYNQIPYMAKRRMIYEESGSTVLVTGVQTDTPLTDFQTQFLVGLGYRSRSSSGTETLYGKHVPVSQAEAAAVFLELDDCLL